MSEVDNLLKSIVSSTEAAKLAVEELNQNVSSPVQESNDLVQNLLQKSRQKEPEGISLLSLKNQALLSYINNLVLVALGKIERLESDENAERCSEAVERTIVQRVTLEKGVKPLERKISYQIENLVKAYNKMESRQKEVVKKDHEKDENDQESSNEIDSEEEENDDELAFRPDASALTKLASKTTGISSSSATTSSEKYKPPKISAVAPPTSLRETGSKGDKTKRLQSMEEYLQEQSDLPTAEASIGSTIVAHGRGGVKTQHDRKKEKEIQAYEESNFTRLPTAQTKKNFRQKQRDLANQFAGEDWSMFNNNDTKMSEGTSRKRKPKTSWDRVKKKHS
ncbi:hypothetical protein KGF56_001043 [Candida oxycetoniae]|uniref:Uncharacterized protein n=1 Tax=Candida oxycetoniae TaxID=497107 RepID=A0AAI9SZR6_9ASCO|nr:uncharacterized protein KGF56_001043 [Candida oxycetoniae]KAI3406201.2 hypothetical protein KGF56_001043 [Candida oxycetoniae]